MQHGETGDLKCTREIDTSVGCRLCTLSVIDFISVRLPVCSMRVLLFVASVDPSMPSICSVVDWLVWRSGVYLPQWETKRDKHKWVGGVSLASSKAVFLPVCQTQVQVNLTHGSTSRLIFILQQFLTKILDVLHPDWNRVVYRLGMGGESLWPAIKGDLWVFCFSWLLLLWWDSLCVKYLCHDQGLPRFCVWCKHQLFYWGWWKGLTLVGLVGFKDCSLLSSSILHVSWFQHIG